VNLFSLTFLELFLYLRSGGLFSLQCVSEVKIRFVRRSTACAGNIKRSMAGIIQRVPKLAIPSGSNTPNSFTSSWVSTKYYALHILTLLAVIPIMTKLVMLTSPRMHPVNETT